MFSTSMLRNSLSDPLFTFLAVTSTILESSDPDMPTTFHFPVVLSFSHFFRYPIIGPRPSKTGFIRLSRSLPMSSLGIWGLLLCHRSRF